MGPAERTRNESVPKIITNHTKKLFLNCNRQFGNFKKSVTVFRALCDKKIASVYFISEIYLYFSIGNGRPREPALCRLYRHTFVPRGPRRGRAGPLPPRSSGAAFCLKRHVVLAAGETHHQLQFVIRACRFVIFMTDIYHIISEIYSAPITKRT